MIGCSTPMTVTRKQAQTMLAAVLSAQAHRDGDTLDYAQLEGARLMLVAALERIGRAEAKAGLRAA